MGKKSNFPIYFLIGIMILIVVAGISIGINYNTENSLVMSHVIDDVDLGVIQIKHERVPFFKRIFGEQAVTFSQESAEVGERVTLKDKTGNFIFCQNVDLYEVTVYKDLQSYKKIDHEFFDNFFDKNICNTIRTISFTPSEAGTYTAKTIYHSGTTTFNEISQNSVKVTSPEPTCNPDWECTSYGSCSPSGTQTRTCTDSNSCGTSEGRPQLSQSCTYDGGGEDNCPSGQTQCNDGTCKISCGDEEDICIYKIDNECISTQCAEDLGQEYNSIAQCEENDIEPKPDYILYVIVGFVTLLFLITAYLVFRRFKK